MNEFELTPKKQLYRVCLAAASMLIAVIAVNYLAEFLANVLKPSVLKADWYAWAVTALAVVGVGLPVLYLTLRNIPSIEHREVVKLRVTKFISIFFICVAAMYITNIFGVLVNLAISGIKGEDILNPALEAIKGSNFVLTFIYGVLIAPIAEELLFRKLLLDKLRRFGDVPAALLTGFAFGLFHMNLSQFFYATALGIIFAYVTLKTNTVRYSIMLHMMINFIGVSLTPFVVNQKNVAIAGLIGMWVLIALPLGIAFFIINLKSIRIEKAVEPIERKSDYIINPGSLLYITVCVVMMVLLIIR